MKPFDIKSFDVKRYDTILSRGLCMGMGSQMGTMCIEAAICNVLGLPHHDDPKCVTNSVRDFKIGLNDSLWYSNKTRADGLHDLGLAQLGSKGVISSRDFEREIKKGTIRFLIPALLRELVQEDHESAAGLLKAADKCEKSPSAVSIKFALDAVDYKSLRNPNAAGAISCATYSPAGTARLAKLATKSGDKYLIMSAKIALRILQDMGSPGCALLNS